MISQPLSEVAALVKQRLAVMDISAEQDENFETMVDLYRQRVSTINELADSILYCFREFEEYDPKAAKKALKQAALEPLKLLRSKLQALDSWNAVALHGAIEAVTTELDVGMGKVGQPLRVAVTGGGFSPPIDQTVEIIGRDSSLSRIDRAIALIESRSETDS